ncbi:MULTISPECIES: UbiA prenyltransferase family protein [unclassified Polaribacter]|jgi:4-hydroxybenzoate polyprenyltransferase|uniref:UbiA prenyltransferase family protein n=1 Tax=unclassified Polaribacter TaxID=196858 RepID=UPI001C50243A|nr:MULTISPECIES: UbiA prenyltransferase family protein [unclassified Polaribacter]QXP67484.1 UbiA prenyltransferase family protein [Polaribacter sp. AHE13PA]QXP69644.1 UbiA prenyltransferase family protein [Polaribacter sp. R2A056_3_33]
MIKDYVVLMRPKHWIKNVLIFFPAFFSGKVQSLENIYILIFLFFYFSLAASVVYIINDLKDKESDQLHPEKKERPLASGAVSIKGAFLLLVLLLMLLITGSFYLKPITVFVTSLYLILNLMYSLHLKTIAVLELFIVALGFVIRVIVGAEEIDVIPSKWIVSLIFFGALYIILSKRRGEILNTKAIKTRKVLKEYSEEYLTFSMVVILAVTIVCYMMYTIDVSVVQRFSNEHLYITTIFVALGMLRHLQQTLIKNNTESPVKFLFEDKFIFIIILCWLTTYYFLIYKI